VPPRQLPFGGFTTFGGFTLLVGEDEAVGGAVAVGLLVAVAVGLGARVGSAGAVLVGAGERVGGRVVAVRVVADERVGALDPVDVASVVVLEPGGRESAVPSAPRGA
jgi:hypothetical protein